MATYGSTPVNGLLDGNMQFLNQGYGLTGYPDYGGFDGDPVNGNAFVFLIKLGGSSGPIWLDTDLNKATGYNGYDYHVIWSSTGAPQLYSGSLGQNLVATLSDYVYVPSTQTLEFAVPAGLVGGAGAAFVTLGSGTSYITAPQIPGVAVGTAGAVTLDGNLSEWTSAQRIDASAPDPNMDVYGRIEGGYMIYALHLNSSVGDLKSEYTTLWLDTDFNRSTGYSVPTTNVSGAPQVQVGAEYNIRFDVAGHVLLEQGNTLWPAYSPNGAAVYSELVAPVKYAFSPDYKSAEVAIPLSMLGPTVAGAKVHVTSYWAVAPALTADGYTLGTPPTGGGGGQPPPPIVTAALLHDTGASSSDGNTSDPTLTGTGTASAIVQFSINGTTSAVTTTTADAMGKWTWTPTGLSQGNNSIIVSQTDANGNTGSATVNLTYDTVAPAVAITSTGGSIASATQTVSGTGEKETQITLFDGSTALGVPVLVGVDGTWNASVTFTGSGAHVVTAYDTDQAGNVGHSSPVTFTLSIPPPQVQPPVFTGMSQNYSGSVTLKGSGPANAKVSVYDGAMRIGTATVGAGGTWKFNTSSNLSDAVHIFTANTTDALGNVSGASGSAQLGSSRADKLTSTNGNDIMTGDSRADTFSFAADFGKDVITDFVPGGYGHDFIDFKDISVLNSFSAVINSSIDTPSGVVIRQDANNTLTLLDVSKSELRAMDFTFSHAT